MKPALSSRNIVVKSPELRLRPMRKRDLDSILAIDLLCYPFPWTKGIYRDCLQVGYSCWVMEWAAEIGGYSIMSVAVGEAHILNLCIKPTLQGRGLGRSMLEHLLRVAKGQHAETCYLEVRPNNRVAIKLYKQLGFHEIGVRKGYYPGKNGREDAVIFSRGLEDITSRYF